MLLIIFGKKRAIVQMAQNLFGVVDFDKFTKFDTQQKCSKQKLLPPQFSQSFAQFGVVQLRVLVGKFPPGRLSPDHEGVHRSLHVCRPLLGANPVRPKIHKMLLD
jgi:hypothetical protein